MNGSTAPHTVVVSTRTCSVRAQRRRLRSADVPRVIALAPLPPTHAPPGLAPRDTLHRLTCNATSNYRYKHTCNVYTR